jgi:hypothetical protein
MCLIGKTHTGHALHIKKKTVRGSLQHELFLFTVWSETIISVFLVSPLNIMQLFKPESDIFGY